MTKLPDSGQLILIERSFSLTNGYQVVYEKSLWWDNLRKRQKEGKIKLIKRKMGFLGI